MIFGQENLSKEQKKDLGKFNMLYKIKELWVACVIKYIAWNKRRIAKKSRLHIYK